MSHAPQSFLTRSAAREGARALEYKAFRTVWDPVKEVWHARYEPGEVDAEIAKWAQQFDWIAWLETGWTGSGDEPRRRMTLIIVTITKEELNEIVMSGELPAFTGDFEPITPELWEPEQPSKSRARPAPKGDDASTGGESKTRAKSDAESPVKLVWRLADEMKGASRADVVAACVAQGVNKATASTQFYRWQKSNRD